MSSAAEQIREFARARGITEVVHFTTNHGLLGVLDSAGVFSRARVTAEQRLDSIRYLNCTYRKDPDWIDHVSMSIGTVNQSMLGTSMGWHPSEDVWWAVLAFDPEILTHDGVTFTTTNNVYHSVVRRGEGASALADMYSDSVPWGYYGSTVRRTVQTAMNAPTDHRAEVLYPVKVPLEFLRAIYVPQPEHIDEISGWLANYPSAPRVPVLCRPEVFQ